MQERGLKINKLLIIETGTYNTQHRRPYVTEWHQENVNGLQERLHGHNTYLPNAFGGLAMDFLKPATNPENAISFFDGWDRRRFRFMMEVEHNYRTGGALREMVLGYTEYDGITTNGAIDPRMRFYINSVVTIRNNFVQTPLGNEMYSSVIDTSHLLINPEWQGIYQAQPEHRLRPEDVYATMARSHLTDVDKRDMMDTRTMVGTTAVKSHRSNGSPGAYMAKVLENYRRASMASNFGQSDFQILDSARNFAAEAVAAKDPFLQALANVRNMGVQNVFTYQDLKNIQPEIDYVTQALWLGQAQQRTVHQAGQTTDWGTTIPETVAATMLSHAVPAEMMEVGLTGYSFLASNRHPNGQIVVQTFNYEAFTNADVSMGLEVLRNSLEVGIMRDISNNNQMDFSLDMRVDLLGETWIKLSLDSGPFMDYVTPSFCDALLVPMLTANKEHAELLANDFELLSGQLGDGANNQQMYETGTASNSGDVFGSI